MEGCVNSGQNLNDLEPWCNAVYVGGGSLAMGVTDAVSFRVVAEK